MDNKQLDIHLIVGYVLGITHLQCIKRKGNDFSPWHHHHRLSHCLLEMKRGIRLETDEHFIRNLQEGGD